MSNKKHVAKKMKKEKKNTKSKISPRVKKPLCVISTSSSRRSRTKTRRPKFLSLQKQIINPQSHQIISTRTRSKTKTTSLSSETETMEEESLHHVQLNLFPLHPDNIIINNNNNDDPMHECDDDDDDHEDNNMALFLLNNNETTATLNGLLSNSSEATSKGPSSGDDESDLLAPSSISTYMVDVRSAMKRSSSRSCSDNEEKWVWYNTHDDHEHGRNLPEAKKSRRKKTNKKKVEEEVTSSTCGGGDSGCMESDKVGLLLKLENYEEILNAWSDKGSVLVGRQGMNHDHDGDDQTVPDLNFLSQTDSAGKNLMDSGGGNNGSVWRVPESEMIGNGNNLEEMKDGIMEKTRQREASVLRYKEKRQNRLFAKRIRYEVRKVNAEKRPRIKGRFVRRN